MIFLLACRRVELAARITQQFVRHLSLIRPLSGALRPSFPIDAVYIYIAGFLLQAFAIYSWLKSFEVVLR